MTNKKDNTGNDELDELLGMPKIDDLPKEFSDLLTSTNQILLDKRNSKDVLKTLVQEDPEKVAMLLKAWIKEEK